MRAGARGRCPRGSCPSGSGGRSPGPAARPRRSRRSTAPGRPPRSAPACRATSGRCRPRRRCPARPSAPGARPGSAAGCGRPVARSGADAHPGAGGSTASVGASPATAAGGAARPCARPAASPRSAAATPAPNGDGRPRARGSRCPSTPSTASPATITMATMPRGVNCRLQNATPASQVSGEVCTPVATSATDQASTAAASRLTTHQPSRRPQAIMAHELASTAPSEKVMAVRTTGSTGLPDSCRDATRPTMAPTTRPAKERKRSCLMAGPRTTSSRGTGANISCCTTGASKVSGPPRPPERRPNATATAMSRPSTAGPVVGEVLERRTVELGLVDLARQEDHEDDAGRRGQVDVVERVDPVDALEPVVTPCSPQVLERASGGGVGHHDRPIYRSRPEPRNRPACVPCDGDPRRPRPRLGQPAGPTAVRGPVAHRSRRATGSASSASTAPASPPCCGS